MKPLKVLGAIDDEVQLKEPWYEIGPLAQRVSNAIQGKNYANYVDRRGF